MTEGLNNGIANINGEMYGWADVKCFIGGTAVVGITAIDYDEKQDIKQNYGSGRKAIGYGKGRITCTGKLSLYQEEIVALQAAAPKGRLQDLPSFDISVSYLPENGVICTDVLKGCKFTENKRTLKEGDTNSIVECELMVMDIKYNQLGA
jgi:hypothetical protein